jgi:tetratricopeptide (TPR) repeat protein
MAKSGIASPRFRWTVLVAFLLILGTLVVYYPVRNGQFLSLDDNLYVTENPAVRAGLSWRTIRSAFTSLTAANWHPLTMLSLELDSTLFGLKYEPEALARGPAGFHLVNLGLHTLSAVLLLLVLQRMTGTLWPSAWVAALFAVHPLHVESVAWVAERKDMLSGLFWMLALLAYARYAEAASFGRMAWVFLAMTLGLLAKPMLVTLPCVLLLLDYWPLERFRSNVWPLVREKLPLFALSAAFSAIAVAAQHQQHALMTFEAIPLRLRLENAPVAYLVYLRKMVWPVDLAPFYPFNTNGWPAWEVITALAVLLGITALAWWQRERRPYVLVGWLWYLGTLVPVIGLVQVGLQAWADRYTYLPLIGIFIALAWGASDLLASWRLQRVALTLLGLSSAVLCMALTFVQVGYWYDDFRLWPHTLKVTQANDFAHNQLGACLDREGKLDQAMKHYAQAVAINPKYDLAQINLARGYWRQGKRAEALESIRAALEVNPRNESAHFLLGLALVESQPEEAREHFREALRLQPDNAKMYAAVAQGFEALGDLEESARLLAGAVELAPESATFHFQLGVALCRLGRWQEAIARLQQGWDLAAADQDHGLQSRIQEQLERCRRESGGS